MGDPLATTDIGQNVGVAAVPPSVGAAVSPSNTIRPGPRPISVPSDILIKTAVWPQQTRAENWELPPPFFEGELGLHLTQCRLSQGLPPSKWHLDPSSRLATTDIGR